MLEILLADFLPLGGVEVKLVETGVEELVGADHGLLQLGEFFR